MARRILFKEGGLTGSTPAGYKFIGFNTDGELSEIELSTTDLVRSWSKVTTASSDSTISIDSTYQGKYIRVSSTAGATVSVLSISNGNWKENAEVIIEQAGAGQITIAGAAGVVINSSETKKTEKQYSVVALKLVDSSGDGTWTLMGERTLL